MADLHDGRAAGLARGLGWFSVTLGVVQLTAPDAVNRLIGVATTDGNADLMRAVGVRELAAGIGLLTAREPSGFLWARVAGDAMDLALLANAMTTAGEKARVGMAAAAVAGVTALDVVAGTRRHAADAPLAA